jgi:DNA polymerase I-like protein with 3'-5' exonuclease and polymerase domains
MADASEPATVRRVEDPAGLAELTASLAGVRAVGLRVLAAASDARDPDDPRGVEASELLLAIGRGEAPAELVHVTAGVGVPTALLAALADDDAPYVVMHDAQLDLHRITAAWGDPGGRPVWEPKRFGCTLTAATLLSQGDGRRHELSLPECSERVLGLVLPRRSGRQRDAFATDPLAATIAEVSVLLPLMQALTPMLRKLELTAVHALECRLVPAVVAIERVGMGVDAAAFQRIADDWVKERRDTTDPERVTRLDKLISTYAYWPREFVVGDRIHCRLHPLAADSGRLSCTDPNLQQVPSEHTAPGLRGCFRPAPGYRFVIADYAQIELRVAAHLAPCDALQAVFREGRDPHRATAATISGKAEADISSHERHLAKAVNFGFLFGMGAARFRSYALDSYGVELDDAQAAEARRAFFATFPGIARWHQRVGALGRRGDEVTVRTALGRRKRFSKRFSFNAALNIPVQGTAAEGFKLAMAELYPALHAIGARGVMTIHDEYIAEVPVAGAEAARALVERTMSEAMGSLVTTVPIEVEAVLAGSWSEKG